MALYYKWSVKTGLAFALQFFMLISDGLDLALVIRETKYIDTLMAS